MIRADGTLETRTAKMARETTPAPRRRGPAVCAMCGSQIEAKVWVSRERGPCRGKPVHPECEKKAQPAVAAQRPAKKARASGISLAEENRRLRAVQDRNRELRRQRTAPKK